MKLLCASKICLLCRQQEQLSSLRQKHAAEKEKRVATQHVKWKFVKSDDENRSKFGLPNNIQVSFKF